MGLKEALKCFCVCVEIRQMQGSKFVTNQQKRSWKKPSKSPLRDFIFIVASSGILAPKIWSLKVVIINVLHVQACFGRASNYVNCIISSCTQDIDLFWDGLVISHYLYAFYVLFAKKEYWPSILFHKREACLYCPDSVRMNTE